MKPEKIPVLKVPAMVADSNHNGTMFGGWLMSQVDIAGSIPALHHAKGSVVTRAVHNMEFIQPLFIGDLVSFYAEIVKTGRSSITVDIDVWVDRDSSSPVELRVASAQLVFVAVDEQGRVRALSD